MQLVVAANVQKFKVKRFNGTEELPARILMKDSARYQSQASVKLPNNNSIIVWRQTFFNTTATKLVSGRTGTSGTIINNKTYYTFNGTTSITDYNINKGGSLTISPGSSSMLAGITSYSYTGNNDGTVTLYIYYYIRSQTSNGPVSGTINYTKWSAD